ncbi:hypothetical protein D3C87_1542220 [compost metagenome]
MLGQYRTLSSLHRPALALTFESGHRGMIEQLAAEAGGRFGQPRCVGHRVEGSGTPVEQRGGDFLGTGGLFAGLPGEQFHRRTTAFPLFFTTAQVRFATGVVRHVQRAFAAQLAIDVVFVDQAEHQ